MTQFESTMIGMMSGVLQGQANVYNQISEIWTTLDYLFYYIVSLNVIFMAFMVYYVFFRGRRK
jgi:hypothetical protein